MLLWLVYVGEGEGTDCLLYAVVCFKRIIAGSLLWLVIEITRYAPTAQRTTY